MNLCGYGEILERSLRKWRDLEKEVRENDHKNESVRYKRILKIKMAPLPLLMVTALFYDLRPKF